jgi:two-component system, chemotaxis family, response regulator Rcp1
MSNSGKPVEILLVEDNPGDARLMLDVMKGLKVRNTIRIVEDGEEAMAFLHQSGQYAQVPRPDLILLDLNLPKKDGREVLAEIRSSPDLKAIPVIILTVSQADQDMLKAHDLRADGYVVKPVDAEQFISIVNFVDDFYLTLVSIPQDRP